MNKKKAPSRTARAIRRRLPTVSFYPGGFVLDTVSGMFYRLSPAAEYLLRSYDTGADPRQFADMIQDRYGVDHACAVRDAELLLNQVTAPGLLDQEQLQAVS